MLQPSHIHQSCFMLIVLKILYSSDITLSNIRAHIVSTSVLIFLDAASYSTPLLTHKITSLLDLVSKIYNIQYTHQILHRIDSLGELLLQCVFPPPGNPKLD